MAPTGDKFDQPPSRMSSIRGKLADHLGDHVVLSSEGTVLATSTGTESLYPRPPQSLTNSLRVSATQATDKPEIQPVSEPENLHSCVLSCVRVGQA